MNVLLLFSFTLVHVLASALAEKKYHINLNQERLDTYANKSVMSAKGGLRYYNRTTRAMYYNITLFQQLPESTMLTVSVYKWINQNYVKYSPIQFGDLLSNIVNYKQFDLYDLFHTVTTPAMSWPFANNQTYYIRGWVPNVKNFPPFIPLGRYRVELLFSSKRPALQMLSLHWFVELLQEYL